MSEEVEATCPYCAENIILVVDTSVEDQRYIEDCSVCCKPIQFKVTCEDGAFASIQADRS